MKSYFNNLPPKLWALIVVPAVLVAYPIVYCVLPAVLRAVVPEAVRTLLSLI